jgi:protease-4
VIVALPATLTGSIGVFGGKFVVTGLLDRLGLTTGAVEQGVRSRMYSSRRPFTAGERERIDAALDAVYADFTRRVAEGRGLTREAVEQVARGRVWTGADAAGVGLVDELGGRRDAVRIARERADLPERAPVRPARHVPPLARLGRPKNSEDPRAVTGTVPSLDDLAAVLGLPPGSELRMPALTLR